MLRILSRDMSTTTGPSITWLQINNHKNIVSHLKFYYSYCLSTSLFMWSILSIRTDYNIYFCIYSDQSNDTLIWPAT